MRLDLPSPSFLSPVVRTSHSKERSNAQSSRFSTPSPFLPLVDPSTTQSAITIKISPFTWIARKSGKIRFIHHVSWTFEVRAATVPFENKSEFTNRHWTGFGGLELRFYRYVGDEPRARSTRERDDLREIRFFPRAYVTASKIDLAEDYLSPGNNVFQENPRNESRSCVTRAAREFANRLTRDRISLIDVEGTRRDRDNVLSSPSRFSFLNPIFQDGRRRLERARVEALEQKRTSVIT